MNMLGLAFLTMALQTFVGVLPQNHVELQTASLEKQKPKIDSLIDYKRFAGTFAGTDFFNDIQTVYALEIKAISDSAFAYKLTTVVDWRKSKTIKGIARPIHIGLKPVMIESVQEGKLVSGVKLKDSKRQIVIELSDWSYGVERIARVKSMTHRGVKRLTPTMWYK
jgi:hypothetical protein